jgi:predicted small metal-binding protein
MSKVLRCGEIVPGCDFEAHGETEDEVMHQAAAHAKNDHGIGEITPELAAKVKGAIHEE